MDDAPQFDRRKIRMGMGLVGVVILISVTMFFLVDAPAGKALMFAIAVTAFVRMFLLVKSARQPV